MRSFERRGLPENGLGGLLGGSVRVASFAWGINWGTHGAEWLKSAIFWLLSVSSMYLALFDELWGRIAVPCSPAFRFNVLFTPSWVSTNLLILSSRSFSSFDLSPSISEAWFVINGNVSTWLEQWKNFDHSPVVPQTPSTASLSPWTLSTGAQVWTLYYKSYHLDSQLGFRQGLRTVHSNQMEVETQNRFFASKIPQPSLSHGKWNGSDCPYS